MHSGDLIQAEENSNCGPAFRLS